MFLASLHSGRGSSVTRVNLPQMAEKAATSATLVWMWAVCIGRRLHKTSGWLASLPDGCPAAWHSLSSMLATWSTSSVVSAGILCAGGTEEAASSMQAPACSALCPLPPAPHTVSRTGLLAFPMELFPVKGNSHH